jgi:predicted alpha/beta hydrolase
MTTAINRTTVRIPTPSGEQIEAGYYPPDGAGPFHAVLMGHGMGAVKAGGLQPFAERFSREGFAVVAIDYRQWGGSTGQPRDEALAAIPQCAQNAMSGTTYSHSMHHSTGSSGLMASCSWCRSAACSTVGRAIRASPPTMGRSRATGPDASCGASRVTVAAAVKQSAASDPIMNPSNDSRAWERDIHTSATGRTICVSQC